MSSSVDDIWAKLKASAAPRPKANRLATTPAPLPSAAAARQGPSDATQPHDGSSNVADGVVPAPICTMAGPPKSRSDTASYQATIQRSINCLTDVDRSTRRRAINALHTTLTAPATKPEPEVLQALMVGALQQPLVTMLSDAVEKCREQALALLTASARDMADFQPLMPGVVRALAARMAVGQLTSLVEPSEEVRLQIMTFTRSTLVPAAAQQLHSASQQQHSAYCADLAAMCARGVDDSYHEVRKAACAAVSALAAAMPPAALAAPSAALVDPLLCCFHHTHSRVRSAALDALDAIIRASPLPCETMHSPVVPALKVLVLDKVPGIRQAVIEAAATWLGRAPPSGATPLASAPPEYTALLLPLLVLGITDEDADVARHSLRVVEDVGDVYCARVLDADTNGTGQVRCVFAL